MSTINSKRRLANGISVFAVTVALCVAQPAYAQSEYGNIEGHVDGAKAGAQVTAVDNTTGQRSVGTIDASGNYSILGLRPSDYTVTVEGQEPQITTLSVGQTVTIDFASRKRAARGRRDRRHRPSIRSADSGADRFDEHHAGADRKSPAEPAQLP